MVLLIFALTLLGGVACAWLLPNERAAVALHLEGFPDADVATHAVRPWIVVGLCFLPALGGAAYACGGTMSRYIVRQFLSIFAVCLGSLVVIWFLMDLSDKMSDFRESGHLWRTMAVFYASRAPAILLLLLPYSLLLALLYAIGKLSAQREIVAMIQSGRGVIRITLPLLICGLFCTMFSLGLNYHWAPVAEGTVDAILDKATGKAPTEATQVLYRDTDHRRLWMIGAFPPRYQAGEPLRQVEVTTTDARGKISERLSAEYARWNRQARTWDFENAQLARFSDQEPPRFVSASELFTGIAWPETPLQLIKPGLEAAYLGIPDLTTWLASHRRNRSMVDPAPYLTQWHYRWALPFACVVTVLLATPLSIHFARRAPAGGIFFAVLLSALLLLVSSISLALGEAGLVHPVLAAWLPNLSFAIIGLYLYHRRISGRPIYQSLLRLLPGDET